MIDANRVYNPERTDEELLEFWLFCLFVRGKNADVQSKKLQRFLGNIYNINNLAGMMIYNIETELRVVGAGQYNTLTKAIFETMRELDENRWFLRHCTVEDLEALPGVGPKTARYFLMNTRTSQRYAALDTHILKFLEASEGAPMPKTTPTGKRYAELEQTFLRLADREGIEPVDLDIAVWKASREEANPLAWRAYVECA